MAFKGLCAYVFKCCRNSPLHSMTLKSGIMVIQHWMVSSCLTHGQFLMRLQRENWVTGGLTLVNKSSLPRLDTDILTGYDATIQDGISALLRTDEEFRSKFQDLLDGKKIDIIIDNLVYASFVPFLSSPKHG